MWVWGGKSERIRIEKVGYENVATEFSVASNSFMDGGLKEVLRAARCPEKGHVDYGFVIASSRGPE